MKKFLKILGIILCVLLVIAGGVYLFVLQYPELKENPKPGKWYRVSSEQMKDSEGNDYHAFFKKGDPDKVMVYFAGGGVSVNEEMTRDDTYNTKLVQPDLLANVTMNMGGLASDTEDPDFQDWSIVLFPYATGDFHAGAGEFEYTDKDGRKKTLYHNGYVNYSEAMKKIIDLGGIEDAQTVLAAGYSAGGFGAALLADDLYTNYFPHAASKNVLVDASLLLNKDWHEIAQNVWHSPQSIADQLKTDNLTLDCLRALNEKYKDGINLMFDSSVRDGDLAKVQNYFDTGVMDVSEEAGDRYQEILKESIPQFKDANVSLYIWDGLPWYDDPRNLTMHTIIAVPQVWYPLPGETQSIAGWAAGVMNGSKADYGLDLPEKTYPKTESSEN